MARLGLGNVLAVAALLAWFPASAEEPKSSFTVQELLAPSTSVARLQARKIIALACKKALYTSPVAAAADVIAEAATEGRGKIVKFFVQVITDHGSEGLCDALVEKPATPQLDMRKPNNFNLNRPPAPLSTAELLAKLKAFQELCPADQFYNLNTHVCVSLEVTPNCPPGQYFDSRQCADIPSPAAARCAASEQYDIATNNCIMPSSTTDCLPPQFYSAIERKCVSQISSHVAGVSCPDGQLQYFGGCVLPH
jgi:hypothetical protein